MCDVPGFQAFLQGPQGAAIDSVQLQFRVQLCSQWISSSSSSYSSAVLHLLAAQRSRDSMECMYRERSRGD